jgi:hypothetical protein
MIGELYFPKNENTNEFFLKSDTIITDPGFEKFTIRGFTTSKMV